MMRYLRTRIIPAQGDSPHCRVEPSRRGALSRILVQIDILPFRALETIVRSTRALVQRAFGVSVCAPCQCGRAVGRRGQEEAGARAARTDFVAFDRLPHSGEIPDR